MDEDGWIRISKKKGFHLKLITKAWFFRLENGVRQHSPNSSPSSTSVSSLSNRTNKAQKPTQIEIVVPDLTVTVHRSVFAFGSQSTNTQPATQFLARPETTPDDVISD